MARDAAVGEAGEVFTPLSVAAEICGYPAVQEILDDIHAPVLEPSAGDGNFFLLLLEERLKRTRSWQEALAHLWAVELLEDNHQALVERVRARVLEEEPQASHQELEQALARHLLQGDYFSVSLPEAPKLVVGNPPYNPGLLYQAFTRKALEESERVVFILPTTFLLSERHRSFRELLLPSLVSVDLLPWSTFKIKLRTAVVVLEEGKGGGTYLFNGEEATPVDGRQKRLAPPLLARAYERWPKRWQDYSKGNYSFIFGWKCNLERGRGVVNLLQSFSWNPTSSRLPHHTHELRFKSAGERRRFTEWTSTKLAAYLQSLTHGDSVARYLPVPPLDRSYSESELLDLLEATEAEREALEAHRLFLSATALEEYQALGVSTPKGALQGRARAACPSCGSRSFHRQGCERSTERERELRDRGL